MIQNYTKPGTANYGLTFGEKYTQCYILIRSEKTLRRNGMSSISFFCEENSLWELTSTDIISKPILLVSGSPFNGFVVEWEVHKIVKITVATGDRSSLVFVRRNFICVVQQNTFLRYYIIFYNSCLNTTMYVFILLELWTFLKTGVNDLLKPSS